MWAASRQVGPASTGTSSASTCQTWWAHAAAALLVADPDGVPRRGVPRRQGRAGPAVVPQPDQYYDAEEEDLYSGASEGYDDEYGHEYDFMGNSLTKYK